MWINNLYNFYQKTEILGYFVIYLKIVKHGLRYETNEEEKINIIKKLLKILHFLN